ncbi:hypothetical protein SPBR_00793 [Sporothrix brasiliensis 5110]|uniref:Uncharacterized protein n=1 Tax=Sporothrix brasiliensis 5110 TaxID=1398154 RepID=A0A0C2FFF1_9PEZI|nr:uncharacterized protein SPBR_00793 [Sporothrix brasiliensis 5110]KIH89858.1 hypothetical protein SPBR_00793 [Sporothrix brasiliensis 5110]
MHIAIGTVLILLFAERVAAVAVGPRAAATTSFPGPWITVDAAGHVATVTPSLSGPSTVSPPPSVLTQPTPFVLSLNGHATTTTAAPPVASATGPGTAGAFMACHVGESLVADAHAPFCQPRAGSQIATNHTYYVVWDPSGFAANQTVEVQGAYASVDTDARGEGFSSAQLAASSGFYAWTVPSALVALYGGASGHVNVTLALAYNSSTSNTLLRLAGPSVLVTNHVVLPHQQRHHVGAVAIAVPVVIGAAVLALLGFCVWSYRHHGHLPCIGGFVSRRTSSFSAKGYGARQSYGQRTGAAGHFGPPQGPYGPGLQGPIHVPPPPPDSNYGAGPISATPTGRSNVFRDELKRQEDARY